MIPLRFALFLFVFYCSVIADIYFILKRMDRRTKIDRLYRNKIDIPRRKHAILEILVDATERRHVQEMERVKDSFLRKETRLKNRIVVLERSQVEMEGGEMLFNGEHFPVFALDMNNLLISFKKKFNHHHENTIPSRESQPEQDPVEKIMNEYIPQDSPFLALFFASEHLKDALKNVPRDEYHQVYVENMIKDESSRQFVDVDVVLASRVSAVIERYGSQITDLYLGSGDKDFHVLLKMAEKHGIKTHVIAVDYFNVGKELQALVSDRLHLLY